MSCVIISTGMPQWLAHLRELVAQFGAQHGVERGKGLVEQQHLRLAGQRAGQRHALLLAAREVARPAVGQRRRPKLSSRACTRPASLADSRAAVPGGQAEGDVLAHREVREQRVVLEQVADAALPARARRCAGPRRTACGRPAAHGPR
jgi:hypothetical protein